MESEERTCPRCQGIGKIKKKYRISNDPHLKWCYKCLQFIPRINFYRNTSCCKVCHSNKQKPRRFFKHCTRCGIGYWAVSESQFFCSRRCNCAALSEYKMYNSTPNDFRDEVLEDIKNSIGVIENEV